MLPPLPRPIQVKREQTGEPRLDRVQEDLRRTSETLNALLAFLGACPLLIGRAITVRLVTNVATTITHKLGTPAAFITIRPNHDGDGTAGTVHESSSGFQSAIDQNNKLSIYSTVTGTFDLWFYPRVSRAFDSATGQSPVL